MDLHSGAAQQDGMVKQTMTGMLETKSQSSCEVKITGQQRHGMFNFSELSL